MAHRRAQGTQQCRNQHRSSAGRNQRPYQLAKTSYQDHHVQVFYLWESMTFSERMPLHGLLLGPGTTWGPGRKGATPEQFTIPVWLNGQMTWAFLDTGCGRSLVRQAPGPETGEWMTLKCIHGDIKDYPTKVIRIEIGQKHFFCRAGVVAKLGAPLLIGRDCPIFQQLVRQREMKKGKKPVTGLAATAAAETKLPLPVGPGELAHLTNIDPSLFLI